MGDSGVYTWNARRKAVLSWLAVDRLIARREVHLWEKTLWRMLYETCARPEGILGANIEDLDLAARRSRSRPRAPGARTAAAGRCGRTSCWRPSPGTWAPPGS